MHCPDCGIKVNDGQQFCRSCGAGLGVDARRRRIHPMFWSMAVVLLGAMVAMIGSSLGYREVKLFGGLFSMLGLFALVSVALLGLGNTRRPKKRVTGDARTVTTQPASLEAADTTNKLPPIPAAAHFTSVTEDTTDLLEIREHRRSG